ncbi:hypothetical protein PUNSTDRAFT_42002 [Punctularia strigosozonata HHB-11173 SS5]|uniref:uncharacterized protein n=1 Tax=Punctularia strigosozonata (strain HHB-11173) TaxID=741275 RepID=UPI0004417006|nr:uncharacterized protein PUNSTDRAFT_42002 [Punctularia strigosozonata HHB-11173 SS5]EIN12360.1 hypothetical protein PUNSTDRAFT_42002 [Punctularia strigosozonata HHB-11173 SS5]
MVLNHNILLCILDFLLASTPAPGGSTVLQAHARLVALGQAHLIPCTGGMWSCIWITGGRIMNGYKLRSVALEGFATYKLTLQVEGLLQDAVCISQDDPGYYPEEDVPMDKESKAFHGNIKDKQCAKGARAQTMGEGKQCTQLKDFQPQPKPSAPSCCKKQASTSRQALKKKPQNIVTPARVPSNKSSDDEAPLNAPACVASSEIVSRAGPSGPLPATSPISP